MDYLNPISEQTAVLQRSVDIPESSSVVEFVEAGGALNRKFYGTGHNNGSYDVAFPTNITPICTLPPEIMAIVFKLACNRDTWCTPHQLSDGVSRSVEIVISQVSRQWRALALATPFIWSWIDVPAIRNHAKKLRAARTYLLRSNAHAIDIKIEAHITITEFVEIFAVHLSRCSSLLVVFPQRSFWDGFAVYINTVYAPMLHSLDLRYSGPYLAILDLDHVPILSSNGIPGIKDLSIPGLPMKPKAGLYTGLTSLKISTAPQNEIEEWKYFTSTYTSLRNILNGHNTLEYLIFIGDIFLVEQVLSRQEHLTLPVLKYLVFETSTTLQDLTVILKHLNAPLLSNLVIMVLPETDMESFPVGDVEGLASVQILTVHFEKSPAGAALLSHLSRLCNCIIILELRLESIDAFTALIQQSPRAWDHLQSLVLTFWAINACDALCIVDLRQVLDLRIRSGVPLKELVWDVELMKKFGREVSQLEIDFPQVMTKTYHP